MSRMSEAMDKSGDLGTFCYCSATSKLVSCMSLRIRSQLKYEGKVVAV